MHAFQVFDEVLYMKESYRSYFIIFFLLYRASWKSKFASKRNDEIHGRISGIFRSKPNSTIIEKTSKSKQSII